MEQTEMIGKDPTHFLPFTALGIVYFSCCGQNFEVKSDNLIRTVKCTVCHRLYDLHLQIRRRFPSKFPKGTIVLLKEASIVKVGGREQRLEPGHYTVNGDPYDVFDIDADQTLLEIPRGDKLNILLASISNALIEEVEVSTSEEPQNKAK